MKELEDTNLTPGEQERYLAAFAKVNKVTPGEMTPGKVGDIHNSIDLQKIIGRDNIFGPAVAESHTFSVHAKGESLEQMRARFETNESSATIFDREEALERRLQSEAIDRINDPRGHDQWGDNKSPAEEAWGPSERETYENSASSADRSAEEGLTTGGFRPSAGHWTNDTGPQNKGTPEPGLPENPDYKGVQPIILDLDGNGIQITELDRSNVFIDATGDGLENRTAWAAAGNAVLFYDPDGRNAITEMRQYVFTEWDPTAASDMDALRAVFDTNGDGILDATDAEFGKFKLLVTNAIGRAMY